MGILEGKRAIVTGAASGIGRATAVLLAREGAAVIAADLDEAGVRERRCHASRQRAAARPAVLAT